VSRITLTPGDFTLPRGIAAEMAERSGRPWWDDRTVSLVLVVLGQRRLTLIFTVSSAESVSASPL
jgi:hypothetical protein